MAGTSTIDKENNPPAATQEFMDYADNALLKFEFETLPDGEYLLYLTSPDASKGVGVWGNYDAEDLRARAYADDEVWENGGFSVSVHYTKTPNKLFGPIQDTGF